MARNETTTLGKIAALTAKLLSGWKVPTLKDAKALAAFVLRRKKWESRRSRH
jgi:hypothetical protein